jgi:hypothetical protein
LSASWINSVPLTGDPSLWLLACLAATVGLPFFIISSNSPLLQKWFSRTASDSARDPYFLYAASNAGSLLSLLAYPVVLEPFFTLRTQSRLWTIVYGVMVLLIGVHALLLYKSKSSEATNTEVVVDINEPKLTLNRRLRWLLLAFCAVEPDARRHQLHHDRYRFGAVVVDHSARVVPVDDGLCFRAAASGFVTFDRPGRARRNRGPVDALSRRQFRTRFAHPDRLSPRLLLLRGVDVSQASSPPIVLVQLISRSFTFGCRSAVCWAASSTRSLRRWCLSR